VFDKCRVGRACEPHQVRCPATLVGLASLDPPYFQIDVRRVTEDIDRMRLILLDLPGPNRFHFDPIALCRPIWELRLGMTTLGEKLVAAAGAASVGCFVPPYMAEVYRAESSWPVNDPSVLRGDDLLLVHSRVKAACPELRRPGPSEVILDSAGEVLLARISRADLTRLNASSLDGLLASAREMLPCSQRQIPAWQYLWDMVLANPAHLTDDFATAGRRGIEGAVEEPRAIRGSLNDVYVAPTARVHPLVAIDAEHGPVYIDEHVEIQSFTRIEGPCYIGPGTILLGAKCRGGNTLGPMCRVGGEVEGSILQGYVNKYHDGFLGHAYLGEWVNLGALTTNSDLKNDYTSVSVMLDGHSLIDTGSPKVGAMIGDHTKTSIGTLLNTGSCVGAMSLLAEGGKLLPKFIPSFVWMAEGTVSQGFGRQAAYQTAARVLERRGKQWTPAMAALWDAVFQATSGPRDDAIRRSRYRRGEE
jgi:UDP-N-acetylglucosamine diphosphorylase/glucosamine-1-phosphate N-acetyltransferase